MFLLLNRLKTSTFGMIRMRSPVVMAVHGNVAAATQNQAMNALVFLYKRAFNHASPGERPTASPPWCGKR